MTVARLLLLTALLAGTGQAAEIRPPPGPLAPGQMAQFTYIPDQPSTGTLAVTWSDTTGRLIEHRSISVEGGVAVPFRIDLGRAVTMGNTLVARFATGGVPQPPVSLQFIAPPRGAPWLDWQTILYQQRSPTQLTTLRQIGLTGGMVFANRDDPAKPDAAVATLVDQNLHWYVENIATDFYAQYHRWRPGRIENADLLDAKALHRQAPADLAAFIRSPSLSDPDRIAAVQDRLATTVRTYAQYRPLYYSLADEPGIADLASAWDFDFSAASLDGFRTWLQFEYASLEALNAEWDTHFAAWTDIVPPTTDQAMARHDGNFAGWSDFKAWMDDAFARAIQDGTAAIHAADPHALSAIEGAQIPGWGGYDYARLAPATDVMEIYDFGQNVDMARSFNSDLVMLSTISGEDDQQLHVLWRSLLMGMRGVILWDETDGLVHADGSLADAGRRLQPALSALRDGLGALLINSRPDPAPVAILASPASFKIEWMLRRQPQGPAWAARDAEAEYQDTPLRAAIRGFDGLTAHLGVQGRFISPAMLANGDLERDGTRVLILPHVLAVSPREAEAIQRFAGSGGTVIADIVPGEFDGHGRRQDRPALETLFPPASLFPSGDAVAVDPAALDRFERLLGQAGVVPAVHFTRPDGGRATDVSIYRYRLGGIPLIALQRDAANPDATAPVTISLPAERAVYSLLDGHFLGRTGHVSLPVGHLAPVLLALPDHRLAAPILAAPAEGRPGEDVTVQIEIAHAPAIFHVAVTDPGGAIDRRYSGNLVSPGQSGTWRIPLALNDRPGSWSVTATDMITGEATIAPIAVAAPR